MAEWLKNVCLGPFKYGLNKANIVAVKAISLIFNLYGKRLLNMDTDKIIMKNECDNDRDNFYLYPLHLKQIEQDIGLNLMKIESGIINDLVISVPWKAILSEPTLISISNINLITSFSQNTNSIYLSTLENTNSYFATSNMTRENQDLLNAYKEINVLLTDYFNKINIEIKLIEIVLLNHFKIVMHGINYNNNSINIEKIYLFPLTGFPIDAIENKLVEINKIKFNVKEFLLDIHEIIINPKVVGFIPNFYTNNSKNNFMFKISVNIFRMDKILIKEIELDIDQDNLIVKKLLYLHINDILIFKETSVWNVTSSCSDPELIPRGEISNNNLLLFDFKSNICSFEKNLNIKIGSVPDLVDWLKDFYVVINSMTDKLIVVSLDESVKKNPLHIINITTNFVYGDDIFDIFINTICIDDEIKLNNVKIMYDDKIGIFNNILFEKNSVILLNSVVKSKEFDMISKLTKIIKEPSNLDIYFDSANVSNIIQIVNFITFMIEKFIPKSNEPIESVQLLSEEQNDFDLLASTTDLSEMLILMDKEDEILKPLMVNIIVRDSNIFSKHENIDFNVFVINGNICVTTKSATNVIADILMNGYLIARLDSKYVSTESILINSLHIFIDPEIFDQFNYLFGTLTPETSDEIEEEIEISVEGLKQLREALSRSIISKSVIDLENTLSKSTNNILQNNTIIKSPHIITKIFNSPSMIMLATSFANLRDIIIDEYSVEPTEEKDVKLELFINSFHIYFFDKLVKYGSGIKSDVAFLCVVIKEINLKKKIECVVEENDKPFIRIIEYGNPKTKNRERYTLKIKTGAIIDVACNDPEWKYFVKFPNNNMLDANIILHGDFVRANIIVGPLTTNIREETLFRLLAFFSNSHHVPKNNNSIYIEYFNISSIDISVNYYPLILKQIGMDSNAFTLKDFKIRLTSQSVSCIDGFDKLISIIGTRWKDDVNPNNILQFVPNIKIIHPYATPIAQFLQLTTRYFKNAKNKKKIRSITKNINHGADIVSSLIKYGVNHVWEYFN
jgi:hypothetical protein